MNTTYVAIIVAVVLVLFAVRNVIGLVRFSAKFAMWGLLAVAAFALVFLYQQSQNGATGSGLPSLSIETEDSR